MTRQQMFSPSPASSTFLPLLLTAQQLLTRPQEPSPCGVAAAGGPASGQSPGLGPSLWAFIFILIS